MVKLRVVSADYFRAIGMQVIRCRAFQPSDGAGAPEVAVTPNRWRASSAPAETESAWPWGAPGVAVFRLVLGQSMRLVAAGIVIGLAGARGLTRLIARELYHTP